MGDRYTITADRDQLVEFFERDISERYEPRYNAAPTQILPVITQGSEGSSYFYWGQLPERSHNRSIGEKLLYAQAEKITGSRAGIQSLEQFRCVVPMDGFYAWRQVSRKGRIPHRIVQREGQLFAAAGLWEEFEDDDGEVAHTFKLITVQTPSGITEITSRMPMVLNKDQTHQWLSIQTTDTQIREMLSAAMPNDFRAYTVSPRIEKITNDSPGLIDPFSPVDQFGNYSLFD